jgi:cytochrome P450
MIRITTAPLKLSSGITLPTGTRFAFNSHALHFSPETTTFSPAYNPASAKPPSEFDGFRFSNLRAMPGKENRHQFVTTSAESISFGHGNHACPGRFFASNEIKVVLIELLRNWNFRLKGDVLGLGGEDKRPENVEYKMTVAPNQTAEIEFRRRKL